MVQLVLVVVWLLEFGSVDWSVLPLEQFGRGATRSTIVATALLGAGSLASGLYGAYAHDRGWLMAAVLGQLLITEVIHVGFDHSTTRFLAAFVNVTNICLAWLALRLGEAIQEGDFEHRAGRARKVVFAGLDLPDMTVERLRTTLTFVGIVEVVLGSVTLLVADKSPVPIVRGALVVVAAAVALVASWQQTRTTLLVSLLVQFGACADATSRIPNVMQTDINQHSMCDSLRAARNTSSAEALAEMEAECGGYSTSADVLVGLHFCAWTVLAVGAWISWRMSERIQSDADSPSMDAAQHFGGNGRGGSGGRFRGTTGRVECCGKWYEGPVHMYRQWTLACMPVQLLMSGVSAAMIAEAPADSGVFTGLRTAHAIVAAVALCTVVVGALASLANARGLLLLYWVLQMFSMSVALFSLHLTSGLLVVDASDDTSSLRATQFRSSVDDGDRELVSDAERQTLQLSTFVMGSQVLLAIVSGSIVVQFSEAIQDAFNRHAVVDALTGIQPGAPPSPERSAVMVRPAVGSAVAGAGAHASGAGGAGEVKLSHDQNDSMVSDSEAGSADLAAYLSSRNLDGGTGASPG